MTGTWWVELLISVALALALIWIVLLVALAFVRPRGAHLKEALRLLPDVLRLIRRLAADPSLPRGVRIRLGLLLAYLALPLDLVPDVIPVLGYADDAIIVTAVLRGVVRRAGIEAVHRHWPDTPDGFVVLCRLTGLSPHGSASARTPPEAR
ncbi:YkvA family protein [Citricoccus nitrophenolicus]|uniref:YkvA family protein n=1 Tax=Citricoccus nitrophenolicus TaxID=863575 RepID=UPI0039B581CA